MAYGESKVYSDGSHYIAIPHTTRPSFKRPKPPEEEIEVLDNTREEIDESSPSNIEGEPFTIEDIEEHTESEREDADEPPVTQPKPHPTPKKTTRKQLFEDAYAESLGDDMLFLQAAYRMCNRNPLGSAAGYGSSFPLNRAMTTELLGFDSMNYNVVYAQMGRGKSERNVAFALASVAGTLSKLAFDACMFNSQNFGFVKLPAECTTGSSIMPHKKNPDVFEIMRAKCNRLQALPMDIAMIMNNLPSGYFRDLQIIKELFLPAFADIKECIAMATYIIERIEVKKEILCDSRYDAMFSVEEVNRLATEGMPFRDAYKKVGLDIEAGTFTPNKNVCHTHEGSIGNLCNEEIKKLMYGIYDAMDFDKARNAEKALLSE